MFCVWCPPPGHPGMCITNQNAFRCIQVTFQIVLTGGSSRASCCEAWGSQPPKFVSLGILAMRSESAKPRGLTKLSFECNCLPMSSWSWPPFGALQSEQSEHPRKLSNFPKPKIPSLQALAQNIPCSPREVTRAATEPQSRCALYDRCMLCVKLCALWVSFCIIYLAKLI